MIDAFVIDPAGKVINCIVVQSLSQGQKIIDAVYGPGFALDQRTDKVKSVDLPDESINKFATFNKATREYTRADGVKIIADPVPIEPITP